VNLSGQPNKDIDFQHRQIRKFLPMCMAPKVYCIVPAASAWSKGEYFLGPTFWVVVLCMQGEKFRLLS